MSAVMGVWDKNCSAEFLSQFLSLCGILMKKETIFPQPWPFSSREFVIVSVHCCSIRNPGLHNHTLNVREN